MAAKGYDDSPPRNGTIVFYTILALAILVAIKLTLDSYFAKVMTAEIHDKVLTRGMEPVKAMRVRERTMQEAPGMQRAMEVLSQRGRTASPVITPKSGMGEDGYGMEEVRGWTKLNRKVRAVVRPGEAPASDAGVEPAIDPNAAPADAVAPAAAPAPAPAAAPAPAPAQPTPAPAEHGAAH